MSKVFTRNSGEWTPNSLVDQWAFCAVAGEYYEGSWKRIKANSGNAITVDSDIDPAVSSVRISPWNPIAALYPCDYGIPEGNDRFWSGDIDTTRRHLWPAPGTSDVFVRFDLATKTITGVWEHGYGPQAPMTFLDSLFYGVRYDAGRDILVTLPGICPDIVIIDPSNPEPANWLRIAHGQEYIDPAHPNGNGYFTSGFLTADELWLIPYASTSFVIMNLDTHAIERFVLPVGRTNALPTGIYDGSQYWYGASNEGIIIKLDVQNRTAEPIINPFSDMPNWNPASVSPITAIYQGGCVRDGSVTLAPDWGPIITMDIAAPHCVSQIPLSGLAKYTKWPRPVGQYYFVHEALGWLWFFGLNNPVLSCLNPATNKLYTFPLGYGYLWSDAVWDETEQSFFSIPCVYPAIAQITPDLEKIQMLEEAA